MQLKSRLLHKASKIGLAKKITEDFIVIDSVLPNKDAIGPRNSDTVEFCKILPDFKYYTMYPIKIGDKSWYTHVYGMTEEAFNQNLKAYEVKYPATKGKIKYLYPNKQYKIKLAYTYFLAETYTLLPFLEKNKIPFVFLLNPGGGFGIENESSDNMLREVTSSKYFRAVIVNQELFKEYIVNKKFCSDDKVLYDFSGSAQFKQKDVVDKKYYKKNKKTFDICFVAAKYSPKGVDKGYDLFIAAAKKIAKLSPDIRFHVVGGFDENEIDVQSLGKQITFYGYMSPDDLPKFYSGMDIYMSPNRPHKLYQGGFDGFPLSAGAMYCGVCGFNTDEMKLNREFEPNEVVIIKPQVNDIVDKVAYYYGNLAELYEISRNGQIKAQHFYDIEQHIKGRIELFKKLSRDAS